MKTIVLLGRPESLDSLSPLAEKPLGAYGLSVQKATDTFQAEAILTTCSVDVLVVFGFSNIFSQWIDKQDQLPPTIYWYIEGVDKKPTKEGVTLFPHTQTRPRLVDVALEKICPKTALLLGLSQAAPTDPLERTLIQEGFRPIRTSHFLETKKIFSKDPVDVLIIYANGDQYIAQIKEYPGELPLTINLLEYGSSRNIKRKGVINVPGSTPVDLIIKQIESNIH